jgi:tRNA G18 (ribose-2'-O)-methylase SpoU
MPQIRLDRADDPRVQEYRAVSEPELVRESGLFVAEGRLVVRRAIEDGRYHVRSLLLSEAARRDLEPVFGCLAEDVPIYICAAGDFLTIAGFDIHRGCLALVRRPAVLSAENVVGTAKVVVVLEAVANADNVGGVFRNAAAFGADAVLLSPSCCDPLYRKAIRTSMAATLQVPFARIEDWPHGLAALGARGFTVVGLTPRAPAQTLDSFAASSRPARIALLVGNEGTGLSREAEAAAHHLVRVPIRPDVDSLNLVVATGIVLSRLTSLGDR